MPSLLTSNTDRVAVENANDIPKIMQYEKNKIIYQTGFNRLHRDSITKF